MRTIYEIKANHKMVSPGVWTREAEAKVTGPDTDEEVFVTVSEYDGMWNFVVSKESVLDAVVEGGEEYPDDQFDALYERVQQWMNDEVETLSDGETEPAESGCIEAYEKLASAKNSVYYPVFKALKSVLTAMKTEIA